MIFILPDSKISLYPGALLGGWGRNLGTDSHIGRNWARSLRTKGHIARNWARVVIARQSVRMLWVSGAPNLVKHIHEDKQDGIVNRHYGNNHIGQLDIINGIVDQRKNQGGKGVVVDGQTGALCLIEFWPGISALDAKVNSQDE